MFVAPASSAFSTSSFTAPARSSTTCPEQMRWMEDAPMGRMEGASFWRAVEGAGSSGPSVADGRASSVESDGCAMTSEGESRPVRSERSPRLDRGGLKKPPQRT